MHGGNRLRGFSTVRSLKRALRANLNYQVIVFFVLSIGISWGWWLVVDWLPGLALTMASITPGAFGPMIAAALVTWASGGDLRRWAGQLIHWRVGPIWYLGVIILPATLVVVGKGGGLFLAGAPIQISPIFQRVPQYVPLLLLAILIGGGQEEPGWRGFALPRLQTKYSAATTSLLIGGVWAIWHLPLFLLGVPLNASGNFLLYSVMVIGFSFLLTFWYNSTGGSVLLAMALHGGFNAANLFIPASRSVLGQYVLVRDTGFVVAIWSAVMLVILWGGFKALSRHGVPSPSIAGVRVD